MKDTLTRIGIVLAAAFAVVALTLGYWSLVESPTLIARDDNPRRLLAEQRIERGSILDRDGSVLAESTIDPEAGLYERIYPVPAAAPVVGYYSLRFGTSGIEDAFDAFLRGETIRTPEEEAVDTMLGRAPVGGDVRLTLDSDLQQAATTLMAGETGALVLINSETGAILALDSEPLFDPNTLDEEWDALTQDPAAPLLNRATQSLYQPGTILQSVIYGTALDYHVVQLDEAWNGTLSAPVEDALLPCANLPVGVRTLYDAFVHSCPAPLIAIADRLEEENLLAAFESFGLLSAPQVPLDVSEPAETNGQPVSLAIGQGTLTTSPLQMALVSAGWSNNGRIPAPYLVEAVRAPDGRWEEAEQPGLPRGTISPASVAAVVDMMMTSVNEGAARGAGSPVRQVYGTVGLAVSDAEARFNSWFIGFVYMPDGTPLAVAVLLEDTSDTARAAHIGGSILLRAAAER